MKQFKISSTIKDYHKLEIENVPFENGQEVDVIITSKKVDSINEIMKFEESSGASIFLMMKEKYLYFQ